MTSRGGSAVALARSAHLGPTLVVTVITLALGVASGADAWRILLLTVGMLLGQLSVGWSNDWLDAGRDRAAHRTDKPAADGRIAPARLRTAALAALVPALLLPLPASLPAALVHLLFVASAWMYNLGLKRTPASVLPYVVSFGSLPALATLLRVPPAWPPLWATATGVALGVAAHFANVVPDVAADRAEGSRGLPQLLGARTAGAIAAVVMLGAAVLVGLGAHPGPIGIALLAVTAGAAIGALVAALRPRPGRAAFRAVMSAALLLAAAMILGGTGL
ncbi:UbiA family prenyltransferase [Amnibacterium sp.]|uniref:UbiA family prenyltransferase n=1 Tax=Amnibacterium sp. TaxID=1872496 RepID=UPI00260D7EE0|nr:UbiA family prenyltransferase [Amnibacterium sp.]MCU1472059.1 1,4-dihydroxy-2-naphthoate prenyltransferase [Amnibacterium sp.]